MEPMALRINERTWARYHPMQLIRPNERKPDSAGLIRDSPSRDFTTLEIMKKSSMKLYGKRNQTLLGSATRDPRLTDFRVVLRSLAYA